FLAAATPRLRYLHDWGRVRGTSYVPKKRAHGAAGCGKPDGQDARASAQECRIAEATAGRGTDPRRRAPRPAAPERPGYSPTSWRRTSRRRSASTVTRYRLRN